MKLFLLSFFDKLIKQLLLFSQSERLDYSIINLDLVVYITLCHCVANVRNCQCGCLFWASRWQHAKAQDINCLLDM